MPSPPSAFVDHLLGDFKLADAVAIGHRASRVRRTGCVGRVAWVADRDELNVERIRPAAECIRRSALACRDAK
jgi:hypothetical protein